MTLSEICDLFQQYCYEGHAQNEVEVMYNGDKICLIDKVKFEKDICKDVIMIHVASK